MSRANYVPFAMYLVVLFRVSDCPAQLTYQVPTRDEVSALLNSAGREPVSDELLDLAMLRFRNNWTRRSADVFQLISNMKFVASMDAAHQKVVGRPASTLELLDGAMTYHVGYDMRSLMGFIRKSKAIDIPRVTVLGTVLDETTGEPLQGVIVYTKGSSLMTRTDAAGEFRLERLNPALGSVSLFTACDGFADAEISDA